MHRLLLFLNLSLKMGPLWVLWIFPSVLANAFAFSLSFSVDVPFELITGLLLVVWDFLPLILLNVFQSILLSLASSRSFVFFSPPGVLIVFYCFGDYYF